MQMSYAVHILAGSLSLIAGYVALYAAKGGRLHRTSGMVFAYSMLMMAFFGAAIAASKANQWTSVNVSAGLVTFYLVITGVTTVRPPAAGAQWLHRLGLVVALAVGLTDVTLAFEAIAAGGSRNGVPAFPYVMFGVVALLAAAGDVRMMRSGPMQGAARLARHLWRMCFALFIAAMSFFIGQAKVIPEPIRIMPLLALPVLAVLVTMFYWMWRVRARRTNRSVAGIHVPEAVR